jgi:poly(hydroxyalkanoate) granule-associated protein
MAARSKKPRRQQPTTVAESVQQVWLAGMGAIAKAQRDGPAAFQEAVSEGLHLLTRSRTSAEKAIRDVFEAAQDTVQSRLGAARDQATETWDNIELLFQSRVQRALQQLGVPTADEIRLLTRRVAELNDNVKALSAKQARGRTAATRRPQARAKAAVKTPARRRGRTSARRRG